jgi:DNA repair protein RadA/Sms
VAFGEIGLAGELRRVRDLPQRLNEAARLGFAVALVPGDPSGVSRSPEDWSIDGMKVIDVHDVASALRLVGLSPREAPPKG